MFGNMIGSMQIAKLVESGELRIVPWDPTRLSTAHYALRPRRLFSSEGEGDLRLKWDRIAGNDIVLDVGEYVIVEADTLIRPPEGVIGRFVLGSILIDLGIGMSAGRIDWPYGARDEPLRFGLFNLQRRQVAIPIDSKIAAVEFFDLRGLPRQPFEFDQNELRMWLSRKWRSDDDGPRYE